MPVHNFIGSKCPIPILKAKRIIKLMKKNEKQMFLCDDPASPIDFKHLCNSEDLMLKIVNKKDGSFLFTILK